MLTRAVITELEKLAISLKLISRVTSKVKDPKRLAALQARTAERGRQAAASGNKNMANKWKAMSESANLQQARISGPRASAPTFKPTPSQMPSSRTIAQERSAYLTGTDAAAHPWAKDLKRRDDVRAAVARRMSGKAPLPKPPARMPAGSGPVSGAAGTSAMASPTAGTSAMPAVGGGWGAGSQGGTSAIPIPVAKKRPPVQMRKMASLLGVRMIQSFGDELEKIASWH